MNRSSHLGMALHQTVSFRLTRVPASPAVFWPGCALMSLDGALLKKTLAVLRRAEPEMELACGCCGQPTAFLFPEKHGARVEKLKGLLKKRGVERIYTACPNCTLQLRQLEDFTIIPIWPVLAEVLTKEDLAANDGKYVWHDPCPTRREPEQQEAVRQLLALCGCDCCQPEHTGRQTRCCGNYHMLSTTDPEKSAAQRRRRLAELPEERIIASSCEGCLGAFRGEGRDTCHLLELLFGRSAGRSWGNRIRTTLGK